MNLKQLSLAILAGLACSSAYAIPAKQGTHKITQPDGSVITVAIIGDEFNHTYCTSDGIAISRKNDGFFYYSGVNGVSDIRANDRDHRQPAEIEYLKSSAENAGAMKLLASRRNAATAKRAAAAAIAKASQVPNNGSPRVPILLLQYKDYKFKDSDPKSTFENFFNKGTESAKQYFTDQSNGLYTPSFDVYGPFTLSNNRVVYGGNDISGQDKGLGKMVGEGCIGLDNEIDFSKYDNDGDGECDVVIVLYAGDGEASSYEDDAENSIWPCQWSLSSSDYNRSLTLDRTVVDKFAVFNELNGEDLTKIDGIGTFCHEFSHCLGLPDFYDTAYNGHFGMGGWSLMDQGSYNNGGYTPIGYSAYEKEFMGWINIEEAKENTFYTLPVMNLKDQATDKAVRVTNPADPDEYYILENRAQQGWDKFIPAEGMLISHVTYSASAWMRNIVNDYMPQRMTLIPADNNLKIDAVSYYGQTYYLIDEDNMKGDLWPYGGANALTDTSTPAAKVNTGVKMGKPITDITKNADGTVSFWAMKAPKPAVSQPKLGEHSILSGSAVTINWEAGDENDVTYTLEIKEHSDITYELIADVDFSQDLNDWPTTGYTSIDDNDTAIRLGSGSQLGSITSPAFKTLADGLVTVYFSVKSYGNDNAQVKVSLIDASGNTLDSKSYSPGSSSYDNNMVVFKGKPETSVKVKFETVAKKKRIYLRSAKIYAGDASEIQKSRKQVDEVGDDVSRTITGITGTSYTVEGLKENATFDYRLMAVPEDAENFNASAWTERKSVSLSDYDAIIGINPDNDADAPVEFYSTQGIRINGTNLAPGIYLKKQGHHTTKILIK